MAPLSADKLVAILASLFIIGGVVAEAVGDIIALLAATSALLAAVLRTVVTLRTRHLRGGDEREVERRKQLIEDATARGFLIGLAIGVVVLGIDAWRG